MSKPITGARGGYQMIDCKHQSIDDTGVTIAGIYDAIEGSLKPLMLVNLTIDGVDQTETMVTKSTVSTGFVMITGVNGDGEILTLTVTDEDVVTLVALSGGGVEPVPVITLTQTGPNSGTWTSESSLDEIKAASDLVTVLSDETCHPLAISQLSEKTVVVIVGTDTLGNRTLVYCNIQHAGTWYNDPICEPYSADSTAKKSKGGNK